MKTARWVVYRLGDRFVVVARREWNSTLKDRGVKAISMTVRKEDANDLACSLDSIIDVGLDIYDPKTERVISIAKLPEEE